MNKPELKDYEAFFNFMDQQLGTSNWTTQRRTKRHLRTYGNKMRHITPKKYEELRAQFIALQQQGT